MNTPAPQIPPAAPPSRSAGERPQAPGFRTERDGMTMSTQHSALPETGFLRLAWRVVDVRVLIDRLGRQLRIQEARR